MAPPPARGSTPSISRPAVRQLRLPDREPVQRMVFSDDGSANEGGDISGVCVCVATARCLIHIVILVSR
jgi:hypothetical protein